MFAAGFQAAIDQACSQLSIPPHIRAALLQLAGFFLASSSTTPTSLLTQPPPSFMLMAPHVILGHQGGKVRKIVLGYPLARIQWVAVLVEPGKQLKPASSLAKELGFKDMHTAGDKGIMTVHNKPFKAEVTLDSITPNHASTVMLVLSNSVYNPKHIQSLEKTEMKIIKHMVHVPGTKTADK
ncbi:hypothetical protein PCASD_23185 [Puccinia coronata f. sp. avenae]|uniref:Uncharacterized protein n=1 Tax=Puccinia coronata f. sp. avenae TaxID=200324 RepID=A0A2N5S4E2_9BASI|nr:hypothetical protein PCASD_23185 [Puccinia coronata f. sp. avenae]